MATNTQAPKKGEMREAEGASAIRDDRPGMTQTPKTGLVFEDLGSLDDFPDIVDPKDEEGVGTQVVVLSSILSGANGEIYQKGQIHRISKLVSGYGETDKIDAVKSSIKRLVSLGAIRHATSEEIEAGFVEVTPDTESDATNAERSKRLETEAENARLRQMILSQNPNAFNEVPEPDAPGKGKKADDPFSEE